MLYIHIVFVYMESVLFPLRGTGPVLCISQC